MKRGIKKGLNQIITVIFFIVIAIIIIAFLFSFIRDYKTQETQAKFNCITDVELEILDACYQENLLKIKLRNKKSLILGDFLLVTYYFSGNSKVIPTPYQTSLNSYETKTIIMPFYQGLTKIKVIPRIESQAYLCDANAPVYENLKECES